MRLRNDHISLFRVPSRRYYYIIACTVVLHVYTTCTWPPNHPDSLYIYESQPHQECMVFP
jgi:hypothetical protein